MPHRNNPVAQRNIPVVPPSDDKRWRVVDATMRRHGYAQSALIETLHKVQDSFGYLDSPSLIYVARSLSVPLSKTYGVATFYNLFRLKPQGEHLCVVCMGTACYIKGGAKLLSSAEQLLNIVAPDTTPDNAISLVTARCVGACGIAPVIIYDNQVAGSVSKDQMTAQLKEWLKSSSSV